MVIVSSFHHPESPIKLEQRNVRAFLDKKDLGIGTLYISESTLCWQEKNDVGFSIGYGDISLHAISKDANVCPEDCLYIIIDAHISMPGDEPSNAEEESSDCESEPDISELILLPENSLIVQNMYEAIKICQRLNPDPHDMDTDEEDNLYVDAEDEMDEGHYYIGPGSNGCIEGEVDELSRRIDGNSVSISYNNRNEEEEFEDAD